MISNASATRQGRPAPGGQVGSLTAAHFVALLAVAWLAVVDLLTHVYMGSQSLSSLATAGTGMLLVLLAPTLVGRREKPLELGETAPQTPTIFLVFLAYATVRLMLSPTINGLQNVSSYAGFVLAMAFMAHGAQASMRRSLISFWLPLVSWEATVVFLIGKVSGHPLFGDRSYALAAIVFMAVGIVNARPWWIAVLPLAVGLATVASLSRTATMIIMVEFLFVVVRIPRGRRASKVVGMTVAMAVALAAVLMFYPPFRNRFVSGDNAVSVGGASLNTSGRTQLWAMTWDDTMKSPLFGHGPGTAGELIGEHFVNIDQPHNDYLRMFHDFGLLGVMLFLLAIVQVFYLVVQRVRKYDRPVDWAALMCLLGIILAALTDNIVIYPFVMVPAGTIMGLCLASCGPSDARSS